jgi:hypothetical protein
LSRTLHDIHRETILKTSKLLAGALLLLGSALGAQAQDAGAPAARSAPAGIAAETQARLLQPVADRAVIYLLRDRGDVWQFEIRVMLDGRDMGATSPNSYFRWEVAPGVHTIVSDTQPPAVLELDTQAGGLYFVWQDINVGFLRAESRLERVNAYTAKQTMDSAVLLTGK